MSCSRCGRTIESSALGLLQKRSLTGLELCMLVSTVVGNWSFLLLPVTSCEEQAVGGRNGFCAVLLFTVVFFLIEIQKNFPCAEYEAVFYYG